MSVENYLRHGINWDGVYLILSLILGQLNAFESRYYHKNREFRFWLYKSIFSLMDVKSDFIAAKMSLLESNDSRRTLEEQIQNINHIYNLRNSEFQRLNLSQEHIVFKHITVPFPKFKDYVT